MNAQALEALQPQLCPEASINVAGSADYVRNTERWSHFHAPTAGAVINVACEADVETTVRWATAHQIPFVAQSGGHGWTAGLKGVRGDGVVVNLRGLKHIQIDAERGQARLAGGVLTGDVLDAAYAAKVHIVVGTCNTVGAIAPMLGGGLGNLISLYGLACDNMLSARVVTAAGHAVNVSPTENADLWYGLRGAGHNFGIVTEVTVKAHAQVNEGVHWTSMLVFTPDRLEEIARVLNEGIVGPGMSCLMMFVRLPPALEPSLVLFPWYAGTETEAKQKLAKLYNLGPVMEQGGPTPYNKINEPSQIACIKGGRKPTYSASLHSLDATALRQVFDEWAGFGVEHEEAKAGSVMLVEVYNYAKVREMPENESAFPHRALSFQILFSALYQDEALDIVAKQLADRMRGVLHNGEKKEVYVNFAVGDETVSQIYGSDERVEKLRALKRKWDPKGYFSNYNPIR